MELNSVSVETASRNCLHRSFGSTSARSAMTSRKASTVPGRWHDCAALFGIRAVRPESDAGYNGFGVEKMVE